MSRPEPAPGAIPSLDGIRAVAVGLVFFAHGGLGQLVPGGLGVTMFFVLSGFLITTLLRQVFARDGNLSLRNFYLRRCLRLMPPLLVVTALAALLAGAGLVGGGFSAQGLLAMIFYFGNYHVIFHDFQGLPAGAGVIWSLAVEEHYYLLYPPLALLLLRRNQPLLTGLVLGTACALVLARRIWLATHGGSEDYIGMATDTRIDAILIGCLMGMLQNPWLDRVPEATGARRNSLVLAMCGGLLLASLACRGELFRLTVRYTVQGLAIAPLIWLAVRRGSSPELRWLNARPLVYLGQVSYAIYLSHHLLLELVRERWPQLGWGPTLLLAAALTLLFAEALRRWVEQPLLRLRQQLRRAPAAAATAGLTSPA